MGEGSGFVVRLPMVSKAAGFDYDIVAITGHTGEEQRNLAMQAGCDAVFFKPFTLTHIREALASGDLVVADADQTPRVPERGSHGTGRRLPIGEAGTSVNQKR